MVKTPDKKIYERELRDSVTELLRDYLQFYVGPDIPLTIDRGLVVYRSEEDKAAYYSGKAVSQEDMDKFKKIDRAYSQVNSHRRNRMKLGAIFPPSSIAGYEKLERNIHSDTKFMASRGNASLETPAPADTQDIAAPLVMESVGDHDIQTKTAIQYADKIHDHIQAIHALRTQATTLGITPKVDQLIAELNQGKGPQR